MIEIVSIREMIKTLSHTQYLLPQLSLSWVLSSSSFTACGFRTMQRGNRGSRKYTISGKLDPSEVVGCEQQTNKNVFKREAGSLDFKNKSYSGSWLAFLSVYTGEILLYVFEKLISILATASHQYSQ